MVEQQVRAWAVLDLKVLDVMDRVAREQFVPPAYRDVAYADMSVPLGHGQKMLAPKIEGRILQALAIQPRTGRSKSARGAATSPPASRNSRVGAHRSRSSGSSPTPRVRISSATVRAT